MKSFENIHPSQCENLKKNYPLNKISRNYGENQGKKDLKTVDDKSYLNSIIYNY